MGMRTWQNIFPQNLHTKVMFYSLSSPCFRKFKVFWKAMKEGRHGLSFEMGAVLIRSSESRCWDVIRITRGLLHKRRENSVEDRRFIGMVLDTTKVLVNPVEDLWNTHDPLDESHIGQKCSGPHCATAHTMLLLSRKSMTSDWKLKQVLKMFIDRSCWLISLLEVQSQVFSWKEI